MNEVSAKKCKKVFFWLFWLFYLAFLALFIILLYSFNFSLCSTLYILHFYSFEMLLRRTSLYTTFETSSAVPSLFFLIANFKLLGSPTLELATYNCP